MGSIVDELEIRAEGDVYHPEEDSMLLARAVEKFAFGKVLDIGTGSGIQGLVATKMGCYVTFVDIDDAALECARKNAEVNGVEGKFIRSDLFENVKGKFNTIVFNPPYVPSIGMSHKALDGGKEGRIFIDRFLLQCGKYVEKKHVILLLESSFNKYEQDVKKLGAEIVGKEHHFFEDIVVLKFTVVSQKHKHNV